MEAVFCVDGLEDALRHHGTPEIVHSRSRVRLDGASLTRIWTGLHHPALKGEDCAELVALFH